MNRKDPETLVTWPISFGWRGRSQVILNVMVNLPCLKVLPQRLN